MKVAVYSLLAIIVVILISIMLNVIEILPNGEFDGSAEDNSKEKAEIDLKELFPNGPYGWKYLDNSNYVKVMAIQEIYENTGERVIVIDGQEEDTFSKFSIHDKNFEIKYIISSDKIIEKMTGNSRNDYFNEAIILKTPLIEGMNWKEHWIDNKGNKILVNSEITSIEDGGNKISAVYKDNESFIEERTFEIGKGVISFMRKEKFEDLEYELSYNLNNSEIMGEFGLYDYFEYLNSTGEEYQEEILYGKDQIEDILVKYSNAWIEYVNSGNEEIFEYVTKEGDAYNIIKNFNIKNMKQSLEELKIEKIIIDNDIANAYVREKGSYTLEEKEGSFQYQWIYELNLIDGKWLIKGYKEQ